MSISYEVWATPLGKTRAKLILKFAERRWQDAEKLAQYLRDKGYGDVEIKEVVQKGKPKT
jgi:SOS response regulatory protein OraA/RecX